MKHYKIKYWLNGDILVCDMKAMNKVDARYWFEMCIPNDDVIDIEEVSESV